MPRTDADPTRVPLMSDILAGECVPARMLNEFTDCPRLAFLEWVQGEWADNPTRSMASSSIAMPSGAITLKPAGKRAVLSAWERRLNSDVTHPIFGYTISYRRVLMVQARLLARVLTGELTIYPTFKTR